MRLRRGVIIMATAAMLVVGCGDSGPDEAGAASEALGSQADGAASTTGEGERFEAFPTDDEVGYLMSESPVPGYEWQGRPAQLIGRDEMREGLASLDNLQVWPVEAYDGLRDELEPIASGDEAADLLADVFFQRADPTGCWSITPPEIIEQAGASYGGQEEGVFIAIAGFADANGAATQIEGYSSEELLTTEASGHRLVYTHGPEDGSSSNRPCGPFSPLEQGCDAVPDCVRGPAGPDGAPVAAAHRGRWVVTVTVTPGLNPEEYLATTLAKVPD